MTHINYPLQGDPLYGGRQRLPKGCEEEFLDSLRAFKRQALHAKRLELMHPITHEDMEWEVDLPDDMVDLLKHLVTDTKLNPHSRL
jgi:23S rRNA pseudouridine1911/1915/1917 synthase